MYPYDGTPRTSWETGNLAFVHACTAETALPVGCVEFWHSSESGALDPGAPDAE